MLAFDDNNKYYTITAFRFDIFDLGPEISVPIITSHTIWILGVLWLEVLYFYKQICFMVFAKLYLI